MDDPDDELLAEQVAKMLTTIDPLEDTLERFSRNELSEDELLRLRKDAELRPELNEALELHRPLDAPVRLRLAKAARSGLESQTKTRFSRLGFRWGAAFAGLAAAAAALVFVVAPPAAPNALPGYELASSFKSAQTRGSARSGGDSAVVVESVLPSATMTLSARPDKAAGEVEATLYLIGPGIRQQLDVEPQRSDDGAFRWQGRVDSFAKEARGSVSFVALIHRPGAAPRPEQLASSMTEPKDLRDERGPGWRSFVVSVHIEDPSSEP